MVQSGGMSVVKYLLFIFNFIFVACGIAIIVVGALALKAPKTIGVDLGGKYLAGPIIIIVLGSIVFLIAFLGCCGAIQESRCMLITFGVLVGLIFVVELAAGIAIVVYKNEVKSFLRATVKWEIENPDKVLNNLQEKYHCCGVNGTEDYNGKPLPKSCCLDETNCNKDTTFKEGCLDALTDIIKGNVEIAGGVAVGLAFVELLGIIFACCLAKEIGSEYGVA